MKIEIEVSESNEGNDSPWWMIIDPRQSLRADVHEIASMITGPFFSREDAQAELNRRRYAYGKRACVFSDSGFRSNQYREAYRKAEKGVKG